MALGVEEKRLLTNQRNAAWAKANAAQVKARKAEYYARNAAKFNALSRVYHLANRDKAKEQNAQYYEAKKDELKKRFSAYYLANREKLRERSKVWRAGNKDKIRVSNRNRKLRLKAFGKLSPDISARLLRLQQGKCGACKCDLSFGFHLDHIQPIAKGGENIDANIQLLCPTCNCQKHTKDPIEFMQQKGYLL